ncbi:MAG: hypothetical protein HY958_07815 [Bacteroidia bacterium]|nr:hypothetical protein [Bacteroidia bacterium]
MERLIKFGLLSILFISALYSCKKDNFIIDSSAKLEFSADTLIFDTVFTTIGSTTKQFKIYNRHNQYIRISSIYLANGTQTHFRLNINGLHASKVNNVEIPPKDSLFVFVEVTLNPTNQNNPLTIVDSVVFVTNGNKQDVKLVAIGQDVHLVNAEILRNDTVWNNEKPFLIYNSMLVDTLKTLTINAGCTLYFHRNSTMYVKGTLIVNGTKALPVVFRNDRLEHVYDDIPSQWNGILLFTGSKNNVIDHAEIRNGVIGLQVGNIENTGETKVTLKNTIIQNMSYACIFAMASKINAYNCVIANAGFYTTALLAGGSYRFYHCTLADYWGANRTEPSVILSNNLMVGNTLYVGNLDTAFFGNSIIYGNNSNEIGFSKDNSVSFNYLFDHCLLKIDPSVNTSDQNNYLNIFKNETPWFISIYDKFDFHLDTLSFAIDKGSLDVISSSPHSDWLQNDLDEKPRLSLPDLGAYER